MKQTEFIFNKEFSKNYSKDYIPDLYINAIYEFKASMMRRGYLIKNIQQREMIEVRCIAAKANISLEERKKLQEEIDKKLSDEIEMIHTIHRDGMKAAHSMFLKK